MGHFTFAQKAEKKLCAHNWKVLKLNDKKAPDELDLIFKFDENKLHIGSKYKNATYSYFVDEKTIVLSADGLNTKWKIIKLNQGKLILKDKVNNQYLLEKTAENLPQIEENTDHGFDNLEEEVIPYEDELTLIQFEKEIHDFGDIKEEAGSVTYFFKFKNTGNNKLTITNAKGSCGCTVPEYPLEPIEVGQSGTIKVVFDPKGKPGPQTKYVTITSNTQPQELRLVIRANVIPNFSIKEDSESTKKSEEIKK